jgi:hypothetical protein
LLTDNLTFLGGGSNVLQLNGLAYVIKLF